MSCSSSRIRSIAPPRATIIRIVITISVSAPTARARVRSRMMGEKSAVRLHRPPACLRSTPTEEFGLSLGEVRAAFHEYTQHFSIRLEA